VPTILTDSAITRLLCGCAKAETILADACRVRYQCHRDGYMEGGVRRFCVGIPEYTALLRYVLVQDHQRSATREGSAQLKDSQSDVKS